ncbi:MAG TPA: HPF/RaiA family ribosome-associated protein [Pseudonocardiaceae bacterium]|nr:HPF/RaiA family ribosome-associated protein [Pseudonocardiaceae bacterium]
MNTEQHTEAGTTNVELSIGPGVAPDAMAYVADRLGGLAHVAPRAIDAIRVRVTRPRDTTAPGLIQVAATLATGNNLLRARGSSTNLRSVMDVVCDRLRRQLTDLPHGRRGDHVPHHRPAH